MSTADKTSPRPSSLLRDEFPPVEIDAWRREVDRLLKGAPFDKAMIASLAEGLRLQPLHTAADLADGIWGASLPGAVPYLRGARSAVAGGGNPVPWLVAQEIRVSDPGAFNLALLHDLERGQSAVNLRLDTAGRSGLDATMVSGAQPGSDGLALSDLADLRRALAGVELGGCPLLLQAGAATLPVAAMLATLARERGQATRDLAGAWGCDPVALASTGPAPALSVDTMFDHAALLTRWSAAQAPGLRTLAVTDAPWHEAGADGVLSLGLALAAAIGTLREMERRGLELEACAPRLAFHLSLDTDFFLEIARMRALRVLWSDALAACGVAPAAAGIPWIHARTGERMLSRRDAHTNLLRATTAAMAAVCGGADSLHVAPWDGVLPEPGGAGRRLARNLHLILGHECRFGAVADPAGGSWYVETLTREVGQGAWSVMQEVEAAGGLRAALACGHVQAMVAGAARRRADRLAKAQDGRVGVNRFCAARPAPQVDAGHDGLPRGERRPGVGTNPAGITPVDPRGDAVAGFEALSAALARGATLSGAIAALGGGAAGRAPAPWAAVVERRDAEPFERLAERASRLAARDPRLARAHCLCLGDAGRTGPRLDFARGNLVAGGFDVSVGAFHQDAAGAAAEARAADAAVVMLVGLDETYPELGAAVASLLARGPRPPVLMAAGRPSASTEALSAAGVARYLHLGSDLVAEFDGVLDILGGEA